ncbi:MAG: response regulator transcription factor [Bacteroidetes bacterium]|nr:response regulator transcription factor [Bacteroidota bacterium]
MKYSIVIADDHLLIARALTEIVDRFSGYEVLYDVPNGKALIERFNGKNKIPDIVLLDVTMPEMDGFETAAWLKSNHPEVMILTLSMQDDEQVLIKMIRNGAKGYLHKNAHPAELEKALDSLVSKGFYFPDWASSKILMSIAGNEQQNTSGVKLNDRESQFLQYAATEMSYKEIAEKMFCSPRTVESYRDSLFEKLGLKTRVGLVVYAIKNKLIQL